MKNIKLKTSVLKSLPVQLITCVVIAFLVGSSLDHNTVEIFYTLSCLLKDYLAIILPLVITSYIAAAILSLEQRAPLLILSILGLVCLSIMLAVQCSYYVGLICLPFLTNGKIIDLSMATEIVTPLFSIQLPQIVSQFYSPSNAMIFGMLYGLGFGYLGHKGAKTLTFRMRNFVTHLLKKTFIPALPFYVFGFVLKMQKEGTLVTLFENCGQIILLMCVFIFLYIFIMYALAYRFNPREFVPAIKNMLPAAITGFSTMSSAATMPITLAATEKNLKGDTEFAQLVIPSTVNIHMLGDALGIPFLGLAILQLSGAPMPDPETYLIFTGYFCLAKFSSAGIPGGGVLVLLPVLQSYLGLTPEMIGLITTLYILQDSIFTSSNVMANGAFALICRRFLRLIRLVKPQPQIQMNEV